MINTKEGIIMSHLTDEPESSCSSTAGADPHVEKHSLTEPITETPPSKKRKRSKYCDVAEKICDVCGDVAKSMHFGGMACDSCKAFFRRSVQSESFKNFKCGAQKNCPVVKDNRRICQYCRFQKCLSVGMEIRWVMSEADRMSLWKSKLSKHRKTSTDNDVTLESSAQISIDEASARQESPVSPLHITASPATRVGVKGQSLVLRPEEFESIRYLVTLQEMVFTAMPYPEECDGDTTSSMANLFFCICQKIRSFFYRLEDFHEIPKEDQPVVLRNGIAMSIYLHGAYNYDVLRQRWPAPFIKEALKIPNVTTETLRMFTVLPEMYDTLMDFYNEYGDDLKDEVILVLLCLITLFHENNAELVSRAHIQNVNNRYICLLRNYLICKEGEYKGNIRLTKLLNALFAIKKIIGFHNKIDVRHSVDTSKLIKKSDLSLRDQMIAVNQLLTQALTSSIPIQSSGLSPEEKVDLYLMRSNRPLSFRRPHIIPDPRTDLSFHHPCTSAVFGSDVRTDKLLSFSHKNIFSLRPSVEVLRALRASNRYLTNGESSSTTDIIRYHPRRASDEERPRRHMYPSDTPLISSPVYADSTAMPSIHRHWEDTSFYTVNVSPRHACSGEMRQPSALEEPQPTIFPPFSHAKGER